MEVDRKGEVLVGQGKKHNNNNNKDKQNSKTNIHFVEK